jgi:hypothetical protein
VEAWERLEALLQPFSDLLLPDLDILAEQALDLGRRGPTCRPE